MKVGEKIMYKSKLFIFNEDNLRRDIAHVEESNRVKELQCNSQTAYAWFDMHKNELQYPIEKDPIYQNTGLIGSYQGIPIRLNESLDNGSVGIVNQIGE